MYIAPVVQAGGTCEGFVGDVETIFTTKRAYHGFKRLDKKREKRQTKGKV